jgi:hypothetical protein
MEPKAKKAGSLLDRWRERKARIKEAFASVPHIAFVRGESRCQRRRIFDEDSPRRANINIAPLALNRYSVLTLG